MVFTQNILKTDDIAQPGSTGSISGQARKWLHWLAALLIVLMTFTAYLPTLSGGFIWDDLLNIRDNPLLTSPEGLSQIWLRRISASALGPQNYPLTATMFWVERYLWGLQPIGYHVVNVALHSISAILFWLLLRRLGIKGAWLAGAIFALHPVHVESVAWITEGKNVLSGMFYLLTINSYLRFEDGVEWRWYVVAMGLFVLALLSKPSTVMLPVVLLLCRWWLRRPLEWRDIRMVVPFFVISALAAGGTIWFEQHSVGAEGAEWSANLPERIAIAGKIIWFYISKMLVPYNLTFIYPRWSINPWMISSYLPVAGLLVLFAIFWWQRMRWGKPMLIGLGYFVVSLFPVLGFFNIYFMRYSFVADHFQYLASMGLIALSVGGVAWGFERWSWIRIVNSPPHRLNLVKVSIGLSVLVVFGVLTWRQGHIYQDEETLWRDTLVKNPTAWMAHNNLGAILMRDGKLDEAMEHFRQTIRIKPSFATAHYNIGLVLYKKGRLDESIKNYEQALQIKPILAEAHYNLGIVLAKQGRFDSAIEHYRQTLQINPDHADAHLNLGNIYAVKGLFDLAIAEFRQALRLNPDLKHARENLKRAMRFRESK